MRTDEQENEETRAMEEKKKCYEYELMGKKFYVSDSTVKDIVRIRELYDAGWLSNYGFSNIPEFLYGTIENLSESHLDGKKPTPDMWPQIIKLMLNELGKTEMDFTDENGCIDEMEIISTFLADDANGNAYWLIYR